VVRLEVRFCDLMLFDVIVCMGVDVVVVVGNVG